ncbi:MAG: hypothetical protein EA381_18155 [Planctomycetaceae bacterium]|nr:MAG: hypothetical protein EA381_18155 [Planctomycetaceae bacterium]
MLDTQKYLDLLRQDRLKTNSKFFFTIGTSFTRRADARKQIITSIFSSVHNSPDAKGVLFTDSNGALANVFLDTNFLEVDDDVTNKDTVDLEFQISEGVVSTHVTSKNSEKFIGSVNLQVPVPEVANVLSDERVEILEQAVKFTSPHSIRFVKLRSPVAEEFLGHPLLHYSLANSDGLTQTLGSVQIPKGVRLKPASPNDTTLLYTLIDSLGEGENRLNEVRKAELSRVAFETFYNGPSGTQPLTNLYIQMALEVAKQFDQTQNVQNRKKLIDRLLSITYATDDHFRDQDAVILDAYARGQYAEQVIRNASRIDPDVGSAIRNALRSLPPDKSFATASALATIGFRPSSKDIDTMRSCLLGSGDASLRTALSAHWDLPVGDAEIDATLDVLNGSADEETRSAAVEVLVMLGNIDKVPEKSLEDWVATSIHSDDVRKQRRSIAYLTKTRSGRDRLRHWMLDESFPVQTSDLVKSILRSHIAAARGLMRFDFMSEDEIALTVELL